MSPQMRCLYCGILQDEPVGAKVCATCGGELAPETGPRPDERESYLHVQMELDQVMAPAGQNIERHLLVTLRTPIQVPATQQAQAQGGRPPLHLAAVLDVSGSMSGDKLLQAKKALRQAVDRLVDGDVFSLVVFTTDVRCVCEPAAMNADRRRVVHSLLQEITAHENTNLCGGLEMGLEKALATKQETSLVLLLSDGLANEGVTELDAIAARAREGRLKGLTVSTIGVGADYNEALLVAIADQGGGRFCDVARPEELAAFLTRELGNVANAAARDARIQLAIPIGALVMPMSSAYVVQQAEGTVAILVGDIPCDLELEIPIRLALPAQPDGLRINFEGAVEYRSPAKNLLKSSLNRVTLRIVNTPAFHLRDGVAVPVAERVLEHLKAASVLGVSHTLYQNPAAARQQEQTRLEQVRSYATLLGKEREVEESRTMAAQFTQLHAAPSVAKQTVAEAHYRQRNPKRKPS